jgi:hypothetical protein
MARGLTHSPYLLGNSGTKFLSQKCNITGWLYFSILGGITIGFGARTKT